MPERKSGEGCRGCFYRRSMLGGNSFACHYCIDEGELRGCPAGKGCIHYKPRNFSLRRKKKGEEEIV